MIACSKCQKLNGDGERRCATCGASLVGALVVANERELAQTIEGQESREGTIKRGAYWAAALGLAAALIWIIAVRASGSELTFLVLLIGSGCG